MFDSYICTSLLEKIFSTTGTLIVFLFNNSSIFFMINIYSDEHQSALKYLKNTVANIWNVLIIAGDFNIRNRKWDLFYPFHSSYSNFLIEVTNFCELKLSSPIYQILTCYTDNSNDSNFVIDLIFLWLNLVEIDNHCILPKSWHSSDYVSLTINISIMEEFI